MAEKQNKMSSLAMPRLILTMSLPLMLSLLVQSLYNIVDSIFVARLSEEALTATSLAYPIQMLMIAFSVGTSVGINALLSRTLGAGNREKATRIAATGMILALAGAGIFTLGGLCFSWKITGLLTEEPQSADLCHTYLSVCMCFCAGNFIETMAQRYLQAAGHTLLSMCSLVTGAVTNLILDPILIFGYLGAPAMGIQGAAIATVIGQWIGAAVALLLNALCNPEVTLSFHGFHWDWEILAGIYKVGLPSIVTQAAGSLMVTLVNQILYPISSTAVAFFGIYYKLQNFLFMPMNGLGQAAIPIVGFNLGAKNPCRIWQCIRCTLPAAVGIALLGTGIFQIFPRQLLGLFSPGEEMLRIGVPAMRILSCAFPLAAATIVLGYCASGLGHGTTTMVCSLLRQMLVLLPCLWLLNRLWGLSCIWYAVWAAECTGTLCAVFLVRRQLRRKVVPMEKRPQI